MSLLLAAAITVAVPASPAPTPGVVCAPGFAAPTATEPPAYYAIDLIPTKRLPGTREATGTAAVRFARSPFGIAVAPTGHYRVQLDVRIQNLRAPREGQHAVWVARPDLTEVMYLGSLPPNGLISGTATWNKFLVVVTRETGTLAERWNGTVVLRGMSRSGRMHTMAGHGPYQAEPCARYGY